jgi:lysozyme family protein
VTSAPTRFELAFAFTAKWEGGFSNHPADPGGKTFRGVTEATWRAWLALRNRLRPNSPRDVKLASPNKVKRLYIEGYWQPSQAAALPLPLCIAQFDAAVHSGPDRAVRLLQQAAGVKQDGVYGPLTHRAVSVADPAVLARKAVSHRRAFLEALLATRPTLGTFRKGWMNRLADLETCIGEHAALNSTKVGS